MKQPASGGIQARRDAWILAVVLLLIWWPGIQFGIYEQLHLFVGKGRAFEFDELLVMGFSLAVGLAWFAWRRMRELKRSALALRASEERLADAQRLARIGNWELDLVHGDLFWSDEVFRIFEIDPQQAEASYDRFLALVHPEDRQRVDRAYSESVANRQPYSIEHRMLMPEGRIKYLHEQCKTFYNERNEPIRSIGTVQDITEIKALELQLLHAQKMEAIGTLVGGIAHDFNNILAAIDGNVYLARVSLKDEEAVTRLQTVEEMSHRAAQMVRQLLTFARKDDVRLHPLHFNTFLQEALVLAKSVVPENIALTLELCDEPLWVMGDDSQLQQVLLNLVANARDAVGGRQGGAIRCTLHRQAPPKALRERFPMACGDHFACLSVADNGAGIEPDDLVRVFDPFFTTRDVGEGTGLGLSMAYGAVERSGGAIGVASAPGKGARFDIYLPLTEDVAVKSEVSQQEEPKAVHGGRQVLVVDDEQELRATVAEVLRSMGYDVLEAENGRQAVDLFRQQGDRIGLVIMDLVMPELGGVAAAGEIRAIRGSVPIIFATGYDADQQLQEDQLPPNSMLIGKPFPLDKLRRMLNRMMGQAGP